MNRAGTFLVGMGLCFLIAAILLMSVVPPVSRDALTHHLAIPKLWIKNGSIDVIPGLPLSYYPMNLSLLYVLPLLKGNDILPKYIHFLFGLGTTWMIYAFLRTRTDRLLALAGALIFLSTPVIVKLSISAYVDLGLVFFSWVAIVYLMKWASSSYKIKNLIVSAIACGLAMGTKYNGLIVLALLTLFIPLAYIRTIGPENYKVRLAVVYPVVFLVVALTACSPWLIRNFRFTGNPIYPLFNRQNSIANETDEISNQSMKPWVQRKLIYKESALETALIPLRIFFQGKDDDPRYFDGKLNPLLCLFPLFVLVGKAYTDKQRKLEEKILFTFSLLFIVYASFLVDMRIRYIAPAIPPMVVLTIFGIDNIKRWLSHNSGGKGRMWGRRVLAAALCLFLLINVNYLSMLFADVNPIPYALGHIDRKTYLRSKLPEFPAIEFINQETGQDIKILALFVGKRLYYFDRPVVFGTERFATMVENATKQKKLSSMLQDSGFTHCIIGVSNFNNWANQTFADNQRLTIAAWLREDCRVLFRENGYAILELLHYVEK